MTIAQVSFAGKREICNYAKNAQPLTTEEKKLAKAACKFHDIEIDRTSDGDYLSNPDEAKKVAEDYMDALNKAGASKFSYMVAVDTLNAPVFKTDVSPLSKHSIVKAATKIALDSDDVTKKDIIQNINVLH